MGPDAPPRADWCFKKKERAEARSQFADVETS
jgi:hypothetical protein